LKYFNATDLAYLGLKKVTTGKGNRVEGGKVS